MAMYMRRRKNHYIRHNKHNVDASKLSLGQEVSGYHVNSLYCSAKFTVKEIAENFVILKSAWSDSEEKILLPAQFEVEYTNEEIEQLYHDKAIEVLKILRDKKLPAHKVGYHEMDNSWIEYDPYSLAAELEYKKMKLLGTHKLAIPKESWFGDKLDLLIVAELEDGDIINCHYRSDYIEGMLKLYADLLEENEKVIHIYYINKIKNCTFNIFEAEGDDYPNIKKVRANEKAIEHWLDKAGIFDKNLRQELWEIIKWTNDDCTAALEKLGWKINRGKEICTR